MNKWILGLAVMGLLVSCGSADSEETDSSKKEKESSEKKLKIAYYELEKMYTDLDFSINAGKELEKEMMAANNEYAKYSKQYESSLATMQDPGASLDAQMAADRKMQQAQQKLAQIQQASGYQMKQMQLEQQLAGYLMKYSEAYAKEKGIDVMLINAPGGTIAYIDSAFDVSDDFVKYLNAKIGSESVSLDSLGQTPAVPGVGPMPAQ
ncbi:MAG: OmpH family outer membrane protein [bacterium]|nr:OmpH family outer membrane protein [bacterium]